MIPLGAPASSNSGRGSSHFANIVSTRTSTPISSGACHDRLSPCMTQGSNGQFLSLPSLCVGNRERSSSSEQLPSDSGIGISPGDVRLSCPAVAKSACDGRHSPRLSSASTNGLSNAAQSPGFLLGPIKTEGCSVATSFPPTMHRGSSSFESGSGSVIDTTSSSNHSLRHDSLCDDLVSPSVSGCATSSSTDRYLSLRSGAVPGSSPVRIVALAENLPKFMVILRLLCLWVTESHLRTLFSLVITAKCHYKFNTPRITLKGMMGCVYKDF